MNEESLFELAPSPMVICDRETYRLLKGNKQFREKYDYKAQDITNGKIHFQDLYVPDDRPNLADHLKNVNGDGVYDADICRHQSKEEDIFYVQVTSQELSYQDQPARIFAFTEVTDQVRAEEKARKAFDELSHHIKNTPLALIRWDSQFRITEWSKRAAEISGYTGDEVMGKTALFFKFGDDEDTAKVEESMRALLTGEKDRDHINIKLNDKEGMPISVKTHSSVLRDMNGQLISVLTLIEDLTEQKEAQNQLRRSEKLFKKLFTNAPQAIVMVGAESKVLKVNNSFESLFGYEEKELLGREFNKVVKAGEGYDKAPKMADFKIEQGKIFSELKRYTKHGKELDLVVGGIPVYLDGELIAGFGIYIDITSQKENQRKLKQSLDEKQVLLEEIHHRVKNNLAVISGLLQMQTLHVDDERLAGYMKNSQLRIQSMAIVHEMLYKSKTLSQIQMNDYLEKLAIVIADTLGPDEKIIETCVESDDIVLNVNQAIPCALSISELITNAYSFAFEGLEKGRIEVIFTQEGGQIAISVCDDGIGLPDNFEKMRKKSLGMSLIDNLCDQLDTELDISTGDWGTCFGFTFEKRETSGSSSLNRVQI